MRRKDDFDYLAEMLYDDAHFRLALESGDDGAGIVAVAEWLWFNCADIGTAHARDDRMRTPPAEPKGPGS